MLGKIVVLLFSAHQGIHLSAKGQILDTKKGRNMYAKNMETFSTYYNKIREIRGTKTKFHLNGGSNLILRKLGFKNKGTNRQSLKKGVVKTADDTYTGIYTTQWCSFAETG